jgi:hypothetical protein
MTWQAFKPEGYVVDSSLSPQELSNPLDFKDKNFAFRVVGITYHGSRVPEGGFFYSYDRGETWKGPYAFKGLSRSEELKGMRITARTEYIVENGRSALIFLSAMDHARSDKAFVVRTSDGGLSFEFSGWIVNHSDPSSAIMPDAVKKSSGKLIAAVRRRNFTHRQLETEADPYCWIDIYASNDDGMTWKFLSRAGETGPRNGNPPDLIQLSDGRLCIAYGNREDRSRIITRFSSDEGKTWGPEFVLREGTETDIGYPQMVQRQDGKLVTVFYWAASPNKEKYIEAVVWDPGDDWCKPVKIRIADMEKH